MPLTVFHSGGAEPASEGAPPLSASALAVRDGVIEAVGADAAAMLGDADITVDLAGGVIAPAFADGHAHPLFAGLEATGPSIRQCRSVAQIAAEVGRWAAAHPDAEWIIGASYDASLVPDGLFDAHWLDDVVPDRPVVLRAFDYHTLWVNSAALAAAGIDATTPEPELGRILRRPDGSPLGMLQESGAVDLIFAVAPTADLDTRVRALDSATAALAAAGITWVQDAWVEPADLEGYLETARRGLLHADVNLAFRADPLRWRDQLDEFVRGRQFVQQAGHAGLTADTIKFFVDGVVEGGTAALLRPYSDVPGNMGLQNWSMEELTDAATAVDALDFQLHLHAIGDGAVRIALDSIEEVAKCNGPRDRRPVIAHVQVVAPEDIGRFARLGVVANFEPLWACEDDVMKVLTVPRLGVERSAMQYPIGSLAAQGVHVSFGSDWPVTCHEPLPGLATAVHRRPVDQPMAPSWIPKERINTETALRAYTSGVAYQGFAEHRRGALLPGLDADLVWLSADPLAAASQDLHGIRVQGTWRKGRATFVSDASDVASAIQSHHTAAAR